MLLKSRKFIGSIVMLGAIFVVSAITGWAQPTGSLNGTIIDGQDQELLPGANVLLEGKGQRYGTSSNEAGRFRIENIPVGIYDMTITFVGYEQYTEEVTIQQNRTATIEIELESEPILGEGVTVFGYIEGKRKSLMRERNSMSIVNLVSREEMEMFPDKNTAEVLQRVPGITIQRSSGEGAFVLMRGTEPRLTKVTLDGHNLSTPEESDRAVPLDIIQSSNLAAVEVKKTHTPDMDASSIGGTINLETKTAFDYRKDRNLSVNIGSGIHNLSEDAQYSGDISYAQRINENFGFTVSGNWYQSNRLAHAIEAEWEKPIAQGGVELPFMPVERILANDSRKRDRYGASGSLVYFPNPRENDDKYFVKATWNKRFDERRRDRLETEFETDFEIDDGEEFGFINENSVSGSEWNRNLQSRTEERTQYQITGGGVNTLGDLMVEYSGSYSYGIVEKKLPEGQIGPEFVVEGVDVALDLSNSEYPKFNVDDNIYMDPNSWEFDAVNYRGQDIPNENISAKLNMSLPYDLGSSNGTLKWGGKMQLQTKERNDDRVEYELANGSVTLSQFADDFVKDDFLNGQYTYGPSVNPDEFKSWFFENLDNPNFFEERTRYLDDSGLGGRFSGDEDIFAYYLMTTHTFANEKLSAVVGLRHEFTSTTYAGRVATFDENGDFESLERSENTKEYNFLFPMANIRYSISNSTNLRFGISTSIARPNFFDLVPYDWINREDEEITRGNAALDPTKSTNIDLTVDHYYQELGKFSVSLFYKDLSDVIFIATFEEQGGPFDSYEIEQPRNAGTASIRGVEVAWQQQLSFLPSFLKYLSIFANYTYTHSEADLEFREENFLPGQADQSANLSLNYSTGKFSIVPAINFNDSFIEEVGSSADFDEVRDAHIQFDVSANYNITPNLQVFLQGINLTGEPERTYQGIESRVREREEVGAMFLGGIKYNIFR